MKHLSMVVVPDIIVLAELCALKDMHICLANLGGGDARNSRLSIRGKSTTSSMFDASVRVDLAVQSNRSQLTACLTDAHASVVALTPASSTYRDRTL